MKHLGALMLDRVMKRFGKEEERKEVVRNARGVVVEIGFGSGLNLPYYPPLTKLYGVDPSEELHKIASERINALGFPFEYILASAEHLPFGDHSIDTVVSTWSLCTIPNPLLALKEIARVLKPDGIFLFIEHGKAMHRNTARWQQWLDPLSVMFTGGCHLNREIDALLTHAGLHIQKIEKYSHPTQRLHFIYKGMASL